MLSFYRGITMEKYHVPKCEVSKKMLLKNKLSTTPRSKTGTVTSYLMKKTDLRDQIARTIENKELVEISLNGFSPSWYNFV